MIEKKQYIYRLVDDRGNVLYIGQHTGIHPGTRVARHKDKPWWPEVADWDYEEVTGDLATAEEDLICFWGSYYNKENQLWRAKLAAKPTVELIFEAGDAAGQYLHGGACLNAGKLKLIRTVLWRRDKTVVPRGKWFSETAQDFGQTWDFADFPVLSRNGFIQTMGCYSPIGLGSAHPECAFEDHSVFDRESFRARWETWVEETAKKGRVSYTGVHPPKERSARRPAA
jgi:hypothetical protein